MSVPADPGARAASRSPAGASPETVADPGEVAVRLRAVIQHLMPLLRAQTVHKDLTPSRLAALAALVDHGPMRISELAGRMGVALSTVSRMVDLLEGLGWTERRADPADLRASLISLSDAGRRLLLSVREENAGKLARRAARLPPHLLRGLAEALPALEALAGEETAAPEQP